MNELEKAKDLLERATEFVRDHDKPEAVPMVYYTPSSQLRRKASRMDRESELRREINIFLKNLKDAERKQD